MTDLNRFFEKSELIPAIVQDASNGEVLMLAYMNAESLRLTLETRKCTFFSRSRGRLWTKGETSGHFMNVVEIFYDCDCDTLLVKANPAGPPVIPATAPASTAGWTKTIVRKGRTKYEKRNL